MSHGRLHATIPELSNRPRQLVFLTPIDSQLNDFLNEIHQIAWLEPGVGEQRSKMRSSAFCSVAPQHPGCRREAYCKRACSISRPCDAQIHNVARKFTPKCICQIHEQNSRGMQGDLRLVREALTRRLLCWSVFHADQPPAFALPNSRWA
jgi:hypothetical protein